MHRATRAHGDSSDDGASEATKAAGLKPSAAAAAAGANAAEASAMAAAAAVQQNLAKLEAIARQPLDEARAWNVLGDYIEFRARNDGDADSDFITPWCNADDPETAAIEIARYVSAAMMPAVQTAMTLTTLQRRVTADTDRLRRLLAAQAIPEKTQATIRALLEKSPSLAAFLQSVSALEADAAVPVHARPPTRHAFDRFQVSTTRLHRARRVLARVTSALAQRMDTLFQFVATSCAMEHARAALLVAVRLTRLALDDHEELLEVDLPLLQCREQTAVRCATCDKPLIVGPPCAAHPSGVCIACVLDDQHVAVDGGTQKAWAAMVEAIDRADTPPPDADALVTAATNAVFLAIKDDGDKDDDASRPLCYVCLCRQ